MKLLSIDWLISIICINNTISVIRFLALMVLDNFRLCWSMIEMGKNDQWQEVTMFNVKKMKVLVVILRSASNRTLYLIF